MLCAVLSHHLGLCQSLLLILIVSLLLGSESSASQFLERRPSLLEGLTLWICVPPLVKAVNAAIVSLTIFI